MKRKRNPDDVSSLVREMAEGMDAVVADLKAGGSIEKYTARTTRVDLEPGAYGPDDVKAVRAKFGASQPLLAKFLGVAVKTLRGWEQGARPVPAIAARFLDELQARPEMLTSRFRTADE